MILYSLACEAGHRFESWFASSTAFDGLAETGALTCPACGSAHVAKTIMAPAIVAKRVATPPSIVTSQAETVDPNPPAVSERVSTDLALLDVTRLEVRRKIVAFREKVLAETQDVGSRFPEEARRMHDGDIPHREIRGRATIDEARSLLDDGIMILPLPSLPDDLN